MPSKQLHNEVLAGGCETAKHHGPEGRNDLQINRKNKFPGDRCCCWWLFKQETNTQTPFSKHNRNGKRTDKKPAPKCSSHALKVLHNKVLAGGCETAKTERACGQRLHNKLLAGGCETAQRHGPEGRNAPAGNGPQCLTLPSEPTRNQLQSAAPMPSKQLHNEVLAGGCETANHHGPEGLNDLQINRKNKFPGGRNVPSEILLEILSYPAIVLESSLILLSY